MRNDYVDFELKNEKHFSLVSKENHNSYKTASTFWNFCTVIITNTNVT